MKGTLYFIIGVGVVVAAVIAIGFVGAIVGGLPEVSAITGAASVLCGVMAVCTLMIVDAIKEKQ